MARRGYSPPKSLRIAKISTNQKESCKDHSHAKTQRLQFQCICLGHTTAAPGLKGNRRLRPYMECISMLPSIQYTEAVWRFLWRKECRTFMPLYWVCVKGLDEDTQQLVQVVKTAITPTSSSDFTIQWDLFSVQKMRKVYEDNSFQPIISQIERVAIACISIEWQSSPDRINKSLCKCKNPSVLLRYAFTCSLHIKTTEIAEFIQHKWAICSSF